MAACRTPDDPHADLRLDLQITPLGHLALQGADTSAGALLARTAATLFAAYHGAEFGGAEMVLCHDEAERARWNRVAQAAIACVAAALNKAAPASSNGDPT